MSAITAKPENEHTSLFQDEIYKKDEGEKAINRILKDMPFKAPAMIVSDDMNYFKTTAPLASGQGMPVGQTSTGCYLDAEIRAREPVLRNMLKETDRLSVYRIGEEINAHWAQYRLEDYKYLNGHSERGQYAKTNGHDEPEHIYSLIGRGHLQAQYNGSHKNGNGATSVPPDAGDHKSDDPMQHHSGEGFANRMRKITPGDDPWGRIV